MNEEIIITNCQQKNIDSLFELYEYWDKHEYHFQNPYTYSVFEDLVKNELVSVALYKEKVVSFYLLNPTHDVGTLQKRKDKIQELLISNKIPQGKYAFTLLAATHKDFFRKGLNRDTLYHLRSKMKNEYDFFTGWPYPNFTASIESSKKMGWKYFGNAGFGLIAIIGTTDEKNKLLDTYLPPPDH